MRKRNGHNPIAGDLQGLRREEWRLHLEHLGLEKVAGQSIALQPAEISCPACTRQIQVVPQALEMQQLVARCPVCRLEIAAFPGVMIGLRAALERPGVDIKFECCGQALSVRTYLEAQRDAAALITSCS